MSEARAGRASPGSAWETEGRRLSASLDRATAIVIVGDDAEAAARVALGAALSQAGRRRVTLFDLAGDTPALQSLVVGEDPHGVTDAFEFGLSLARLARPAGAHPQLFVVPTGADPVVPEWMLASPQWGDLVEEERAQGTLLLLVARAGMPGLDALVRRTDGVVVVGQSEAASTLPSVLAVLGTPAELPRPPRIVTTAAGGRPWWPWALGVAAALGLLAWWVGTRQRTAEPLPPTPAPRAAQTAPSRDTVAAADTFPTLQVTNPADSARASAWAIEVIAANTPVGAQFTLMQNANYLPAPTIAPVRLETAGARWYKLIAGAYRTRRSADSALAQMRRRAVVSDSGGQVVRVPYALLLERGVPRDSAGRLVAAYQARGISAYALLQRDGRADVLAGAFATPADASLLAAQLRAETPPITPTLVFRTGRVF